MKTIRKSVLCLLWLLAPLSIFAAPAEFNDGPTWYDYRMAYEGSGTFMEPYEISKPEHLAQLAYEVNEEGKPHEGQFFVLTADINLEKTVDGKRVQWIPIGYHTSGYDKKYRFQGILLGVDTKSMENSGWRSGLKHSISGMYINVNGGSTVQYYGLFGRMHGLVMDVKLNNFSIEVKQRNDVAFVGGLCGMIDGSPYLSCSEFNGAPEFMRMSTGVDGCSVDGSISTIGDGTADIYVGGVVGLSAEKGIGHTTAHVSIYADYCSMVGGVVASSNGTIVDCAADVNIFVGTLASEGAVGGIVGYAGEKMSVRACSSMGEINMPEAMGICLGGIGGKMCYGSQIRGCSSTVSIKAEKAGYMGGIVGLMQEGTNTTSTLEAKVDFCAYGGHINAGRSLNNIGGICGYSAWEKDIRIENCLFTGTISNTDNVAAIVGDCKNPAENVGGCYYDKTMFKGHLCGTEDRHASIYGLTTEEMTTGDSRDMYVLPNNETEDYWFCFARGYYPAVRCNSEWTEYYEPYQDNTSTYLEKSFSIQMFGYDNMCRENTVYKTGSWLCSVPVIIPRGDQAYDLVTQVIAPEKNMTWSETERDVSVNSKVAFENVDYIRISNDTAFAVKNGLFMATFTMKMAKPVEVWNRPMAIGGTKQLQFVSKVDQVWDGSIADEFATGSGIKEDPYLIKNGAQLAYAVMNNKEGEWYQQICDITLNSQLIDFSSSYLNYKSDNKTAWVNNISWNAQYNGDGHLIRGAFIDNKKSGLFGNVGESGSISNLGVIDSYIPLQSGLLAYQMNGSIQNCIVQGLTSPRHFNAEDSYLGYSGGICAIVGSTNSDAFIEDCVSAMYSNCTLLDYSPLVSIPVSGAELQNKGKVRNCLVVVPTSFGDEEFNDQYTLNGHEFIENCYWLKGYEPMATGKTLNEIVTAFRNRSRWTYSNGYFPMLKTFANTDIGKLMSIPVRTDEGYDDPNYHQFLLGFDRQLLFEPGTASWDSSEDKYYVEADGEMGIVVPKVASYNYNNGHYTPSTRYVLGQQFIKATLGNTSIAIPVRTRGAVINPGITFVDENARDACLAAFDSDGDNILSLAELKAVTNDQTLTAFQTETAKKIVEFPEFRFFKAVTELTTQLNGLSKLEEVKLPYALETLGSDAFDGCTSLKDVTIPAKVDVVEPHPFYGSAIENVSVDPFNEYFVSRDGILFNTNNVLVAYPNGRTGEEAVITGTINEIAEGAIYQVEGVKRLYFETDDYETVPYLWENGIVSDNGELIDVYVSDATYESVLMQGYYDDGSWDDYINAGKLHCYYPLKVGSAKAATMYIGFDTELPATLTPYIVTKTNGEGICTDEEDNEPNTAYLLSMSRKVPSRSPVVIFAEEAGTYRLEPLAGSLEPWKMYKNELNGVGRDGMPVNQGDSDRGYILTLGYNKDGELGFFYYTGARIAPYHAYLTHNETSSGAKYHIVFLDNETTGISEAVPQNKVQSETWYTLEGVRINGKPTQRGIYVMNGKKIVFK
ncbi:MAG: leucine-rich repeat protein [Prevotella sp.]|nr:leucine-rich repeat protein [Prevotella sp.]